MSKNEKLPDPKTVDVKKTRGVNKENEDRLKEYLKRKKGEPITVKPGRL